MLTSTQNKVCFHDPLYSNSDENYSHFIKLGRRVHTLCCRSFNYKLHFKFLLPETNSENPPPFPPEQFVSGKHKYLKTKDNPSTGWGRKKHISRVKIYSASLRLFAPQTLEHLAAESRPETILCGHLFARSRQRITAAPLGGPKGKKSIIRRI